MINQISGVNGLEVKFAEICSNKLSAEANAEALLREAVTLPAALDARSALMDWFSTQIEDVSRDLGGVRVTGKVLVEALIASGVAGRPVALVKYAMPFDQLVELPDWLTEDVNAAVEVKRLISQVDEGGKRFDPQVGGGAGGTRLRHGQRLRHGFGRRVYHLGCGNPHRTTGN